MSSRLCRITPLVLLLLALSSGGLRLAHVLEAHAPRTSCSTHACAAPAPGMGISCSGVPEESEAPMSDDRNTPRDAHECAVCAAFASLSTDIPPLPNALAPTDCSVVIAVQPRSVDSLERFRHWLSRGPPIS